jgi:hypothetical protein
VSSATLPSAGEELRCLAASGQLGYGIPAEAFHNGLGASPDMLGADMGSTDPGPHYLGSGQLATSGEGLQRDLEMVLTASYELGVPLVLGSAGTAGAGTHVDVVMDRVRELCRRRGLRLSAAVIRSDVSQAALIDGLRAGRVAPCGPVGELDEDTVLRSSNLVAQMGVEPIQQALTDGAQVVVAGRACDTSIFAALPLLRGFDQGLVRHMSKLIECTSACAEPGGREASLGTIRNDHFDVESMDPAKRCTPMSVAAHALYEQSDPNMVVEPGGTVDLRDCRYEAVDDRRVRVSGSRWQPADTYTLKIEGAGLAGYRCISLNGVRDPRMLRATPEVVEDVRQIVGEVFDGRVSSDDYRLQFRVYGHDAVLGAAEPLTGVTGHEAMVLIDVVASTPETAKSVAGVAKQYFLHISYDGILCTSGNAAIPFSPDVIEVGPTYEFSVYHLLEVDSPTDLCDISYEQLG